MFKNYSKVAFRNLTRQKAFSFINILGLAIGLTVSFLILIYVLDELSYDRYHEQADRIYRIADKGQVGGQLLNIAVTPAPWAFALKNDYPEIEHVTRIKPPDSRWLIGYGEKKFYERGFFFADSTVFDIFSFSLLRGNSRTALKEPYSLVITESMALKYFGDDDPIGKVLKGDNRYDFKVTGVMQDIPHNTHFRCDFMASMITLEKNPDIYRDIAEEWVDHDFYTYLLLREGVSPSELEAKFPDFVEKYLGEIISSFGIKLNPYLQPVTSIHLHSSLTGEIEPTSDIVYVYVFSAIAFFILLIACINFMNLSTARSTNRVLEISMRKVVGANRNQLVGQFLGESVLFSFSAFLFALLIIYLFLPLFNGLTGKEFTFSIVKNIHMLSGLLGITLLSGLFAGSYPAFLLSGCRPVTVLKGKTGTGGKSAVLRKILVLVQFSISTVLLIGTGVVFYQMDYVRTKKLGFNKEHIVVISLSDDVIRRNYDSFRNKLLQNPNIIDAAGSSVVPGIQPSVQIALPEGYNQNETFAVQSIYVDYNFVNTIGINVLEGRNFSKDFSTDKEEAFLINETAVRQFGWESAVGKELEIVGNKKGKVIGLMEDFHINSIHQKIEPAVLFIHDSDSFDKLSVRIRPENIPATLEYIEKAWNEFYPDYIFEYSFLDEDFDKLYKADRTLGKIFGYFSSLAIFVACLGLFGLASFTAERKTKEIGIRKTLGASIPNIIYHLAQEFLKVILLSTIIAWPVAYIVMDRWLQSFAYRVDIGVWIFSLSSIIALMIAFLTVIYQSVKAALLNPVDSIKYE